MKCESSFKQQSCGLHVIGLLTCFFRLCGTLRLVKALASHQRMIGKSSCNVEDIFENGVLVSRYFSVLPPFVRPAVAIPCANSSLWFAAQHKTVQKPLLIFLSFLKWWMLLHVVCKQYPLNLTTEVQLSY